MNATPPVAAQGQRNGSLPHCVSWGVGFLTGALVLFLVTFDRLDDGNAPPPAVAAPAQQPPQTQVIVLVPATGTATATPTMLPITNALVPTVRNRINDCGTATPGATCQKPPLPTATATPYPDCNTATPEALCRWPTERP